MWFCDNCSDACLIHAAALTQSDQQQHTLLAADCLGALLPAIAGHLISSNVPAAARKLLTSLKAWPGSDLGSDYCPHSLDVTCQSGQTLTMVL